MKKNYVHIITISALLGLSGNLFGASPDQKKHTDRQATIMAEIQRQMAARDRMRAAEEAFEAEKHRNRIKAQYARKSK